MILNWTNCASCSGQLVSIAALAVFAGSVVTSTAAESYPTKPIRLIVPFAPGGGTDIVSRTLSQKLNEAWGQPVVVDNRPGGGTTIGTGLAASSAPDGYTLVMVASTFTADASLYPKLAYHPITSFAPVTIVTTFPFALVAHPSLRANSVKELIVLAKSSPGQLNYASGSGSAPAHLGMELFKLLAGVNIVGIPYKGAGPAVTALLAGETQLLFSTLPPILPHIKAGRLRALAVSSFKRYPLVPHLPTIAEAGVAGYDFASWHAILAPAGTPKSVIGILNAEVLAILKLPDVRERLQNIGLDPAGNSPEEFSAIIKTEVAKWTKVVKETGIRADR